MQCFLGHGVSSVVVEVVRGGIVSGVVVDRLFFVFEVFGHKFLRFSLFGMRSIFLLDLLEILKHFEFRSNHIFFLLLQLSLLLSFLLLHLSIPLYLFVLDFLFLFQFGQIHLMIYSILLLLLFADLFSRRRLLLTLITPLAHLRPHLTQYLR